VPLLNAALVVAGKAHDLATQESVLARLVTAYWESSAPREAAASLGALSNVIGCESALSQFPTAMLEQLERWQPTIIEGQARGATSHKPA